MEDFKAIEEVLQEDMDDPSLQFEKLVQGGIVNKAALFSSDKNPDKYFIKLNKHSVAKEMFEAEKSSLDFLNQIEIIDAPKSYKVIDIRDCENGSAVHVLQYIPDLQPLADYWADFGEKMARIHSFNSTLKDDAKRKESFVHSSPQQFNYVDKFGSTFPRYFGEFRVAPVQTDTWEEYFIREIMDPLMRGIEKKYGDRGLITEWSWLQLNIYKLFQDVSISPEIIHSDLCVANFGQTQNGPVLFDPSLNYAHFEMDLLLSSTEDQFDDDFFTSYHKILPQLEGWEKRLEAYKFFYNVIMWYHIDEEQYKTSSYSSAEKVTDLIKQMET
ncbi:hypothetical protein SNE40_010907 [Patella caerulea]|uniref:protein-ribulosamine 3-kinase n=1 Tax=Patella caerulea TaxID=87958 RepID=A0AAN8Q5M9_PATCE